MWFAWKISACPIARGESYFLREYLKNSIAPVYSRINLCFRILILKECKCREKGKEKARSDFSRKKAGIGWENLPSYEK